MSDCEIAECMIHVKPESRKDRVCCECNGKISKNEIYHRFSGIWADGPDSFCVCWDCELLRRDVDNNVHYYDRTAFGELFESIFNGNQHLPFMLAFKAIVDKRGGRTLPGWAVGLIAEKEACLAGARVAGDVEQKGND